ncbi:MAG TPA: choice-of-anchor D domain-containing protein, partial [Candidatus Hydrogenedentes bacterium]|nr:choice-of-anchor D domain-containing protein [Candidatus Hydrogenedentota bacterium]
HDLIISSILLTGMYFEDFSDGLAQDWVPLDASQWSVTAGEYRVADAAASTRMQSIYTGRKWADCSLEATVRRTGGVGAICRLLVRVSDDFDGIANTGSAYTLGVSGDGQYYVGKFVGGAFTYLQDWTASGDLNTGETPNTVAISVSGNSISVFLNGVSTWTGSDSDVSGEGRIGFLPYTDSADPTVHFIDNVTVSDPMKSAGTAAAPARVVLSGGYAGDVSSDMAPADGEAGARSAGSGRVSGSVVTSGGLFSLGGVPALPHTLAPGASVTFSVAYAPVATGPDEATVVITTNDADEPSVEVALTGNGIADAMAVNPGTDTLFHGPQGGAFIPPTSNYLVTNTRPGDVAWTAAASQTWMSVSPASGTLAVAESVSVAVTLTAEADALPAGTYTGEVVFTNTGNGVVSTRVVTLEVVEPLAVSPADNLSSYGYFSGPFSPDCQTYTVANTESGTMNWTAAATALWVTVTPSSGTLGPLESVSVTVCIGGTASSLPPGDYTDTVTFTNTDTGHAETRSVALEIDAIPGEIVVTDTIAPADDLTMPYGDQVVGSPRTESITVSNTDGAHDLVISDILLGAFYREDFSDGLAQGWVEYQNSMWDVVDSHFRAQTSSAYYMSAVYTEASWADLDVVATLGRTGVNTNTHAVFVRATPDFIPELSGAALGVGISGNGSFWVIRFDGASFTWIQNWTSSALLDPVTNTVRLSVEGSAINVFFNGTLAWTGTDPAPSAGHIAFAGYSPGGNDPVHTFDDVSAGRPGFMLSTGAGISEEQAWRNAHPVTGGSAFLAPPASAFPVYKGAKAETGVPAGIETSGVSFSLSNLPTLPYSVTPGASVTFDVVYNPAAAGPDLSSVLIKTNDADEPQVSVDLSGTGLDDYLTLTPEYGIDSSGYEGGLFTPVGLTYTLENHSGADIPWTAVPTQTWVTVTPSSGTLAVGASVPVSVDLNTGTFTLTPGNYNDTVTFTNTNSAYTTTRPVDLEVLVRPGEVAVTDSIAPADDLQMPFGNVRVSTSSPGGIAVYNADATHDLLLTGITTTGTGTGFSLSGLPSFPLTLNPGGFTTFNVVFAPTGEGPATDTVQISTNDIDEPVTAVQLTGNGILDDLWVSPMDAFVASGFTGGPFDPVGKEYVLNNAGGADVNWTVGLSEAWLDVSVPSGTLASGASAPVTVSLNTNANALPFGTHTAVVSFTNTATSVSITRDVELTVLPDPPVARIEAPASLEKTLSQGVSFTFDPALNLCNDGEAGLDYTISIQYDDPVLDKRTGIDGVHAAVEAAIARSGILDGPLSIKGAGNAAAETKVADTLSDPAQVASVMTAAEAGITTASLLDVAVYASDDAASRADVQAKLLSTGQFNSVSTFDLGALTPTLSELQAFAAVLVYGNFPYQNAAALGDAMADYAAAGGGVVCSVFEVGDNMNSCMMLGRWVTDGYVLMDRPTTINGPATLGTVHDPAHPIMAGVTSFNGGSASYRPTTTTVYPGTTLVAEWSDGHPLVAVADVNGAHRADVCFFPPSSDTGSNRWDTTTDGARMLANALSWTISGQGWLQVQGTRSGTVGGGACEAKTVTFDAAGLEPGTYTADLVIAHNDPMNPSVTVPCTLTVRVDDLRAQPETGLDAEGYFGGPFTPGQAVYTLTNAGTVDLPWQAAADVPWVDAVPASGTLAAGATVDVTVSFNAAAQSLAPAEYTGILTFSNTDTGYTTLRDLDLAVLEPLSVTPDTVFRSRGEPGGPFSPLSTSYTLTNAGPTAVPWHLALSETWLDAAPMSGTLDPGASVEVVVALGIGVTALPAATYSATATFVNDVNAAFFTRDVVLEIGREYYTELFDASDWDIQQQTLLFTPNGSPLYYGVCSAPVVAFPTDPAGGTPLTLTDDSSVQVDLPPGVQVYLYGTAYSTFYVGSNGYVTFTAGSSSFSGSLANHFSLPRVAGLYRDLNPTGQGTVSWKQLSDRVAVTFENIKSFGTTDSNNFQIEFYFDGRIGLTHLGIDAASGLAGLSAGAGVPADYLETDLTGFAGCPVTVPDVVGL